MAEFLATLLRLGAGAVVLTAMLFAAHVTGSDPATGAILRIAVRTTAGTMQVCRTLGQAELEALPVHMRRPKVCESHAVPYRLEILCDDRVLADRTFVAAGIHGDRPLAVNEEFALVAGDHAVSIRLTPAEHSPETLGTDSTEKDSKAITSPSFQFADVVSFAEGRIRVATLNADTGGFEIR